MFSAGVLCHGSHAFADISSLSGGRVKVTGKLCGIYESHGADVLSQHDVCPSNVSSHWILPDRISGDLSGGVAVFKSADALIHIYVLLEMFGHFVPEERFSNLTELFSEMIRLGIKIAGVLVLGLNVVQNLIGPAKDRMGHGIFAKRLL